MSLINKLKKILKLSDTPTSHSTEISEAKKKEIEKFKENIKNKKNYISEAKPQREPESKRESGRSNGPRDRKQNKRPQSERSHQPHQTHKSKHHSDSGKPNIKADIKEIKPKKSSEDSIFNAKKTFHDLNLNPDLIKKLEDLTFTNPSAIQEISIEHAITEKNLVCSAPTGSGKTLAFVIPTVQKLINKNIDQVLVLAPTREIAIQIENNFKLFSGKFDFTTGLIIGGTDMLLQKQILKEYPNILIATPGRLVDVFQKGLVWLNYTSLVILDEVDMMLDMGFEKELNIVFNEFKSDIQALTYTATLPDQIKTLLNKYIKEYETVIIGKRMETNKSIEHKFFKVSRENKMDVFINLINKKKNFKLIVFFNRIDETIKMFNFLKKKNFRNINCIHSKKTQDQRNLAMQAFKSQPDFVLLATDIAARGIDVPEIDYVINYELPLDPEDYVHRIGRTGRADQDGKAITFFNPKDNKENVKLTQIKKLVKSTDGFQFIENIDEI